MVGESRTENPPDGEKKKKLMKIKQKKNTGWVISQSGGTRKRKRVAPGIPDGPTFSHGISKERQGGQFPGRKRQRDILLYGSHRQRATTNYYRIRLTWKINQKEDKDRGITQGEKKWATQKNSLPHEKIKDSNVFKEQERERERLSWMCVFLLGKEGNVAHQQCVRDSSSNSSEIEMYR